MLTIADIRAAAARLNGVAVRTPLLESSLLNAQLGGRLLVKPEPLQRTGSFKFRGAYNAISQIPSVDRSRGVLAFSSGNHAQGVSAAAQILGVSATIVMPRDAPVIKRANTEGYGARVVPYDRNGEDREQIAATIQADTGASLVPPFDDLRVIAGQGTVGLELAEDASAMGLTLDAVVVPVGGGGLAAGVATAVNALTPDTMVYGAEPAGFDDTKRSLESGKRVAVDPYATSFCDALLRPTPGEITFAINNRLLAGGFAVSDAETGSAMRRAFAMLKVVVEPGGAVALASVLSGQIDIRNKTVAVVLSGGNVDPAVFARVLSEPEA